MEFKMHSKGVLGGGLRAPLYSTQYSNSELLYRTETENLGTLGLGIWRICGIAEMPRSSGGP